MTERPFIHTTHTRSTRTKYISKSREKEREKKAKKLNDRRNSFSHHYINDYNNNDMHCALSVILKCHHSKYMCNNNKKSVCDECTMSIQTDFSLFK